MFSPYLPDHSVANCARTSHACHSRVSQACPCAARRGNLLCHASGFPTKAFGNDIFYDIKNSATPCMHPVVLSDLNKEQMNQYRVLATRVRLWVISKGDAASSKVWLPALSRARMRFD